MLKIRGISKKFKTINGEKIIFEGLDLDIKDGDFVTVIGSNGAGKSTLMNLVIGDIEAEDTITISRYLDTFYYKGEIFGNIITTNTSQI